MVPMFLLTRLVMVLMLTGPIAGIDPPHGSSVAVPTERSPVYATAILEGLGGTGWARDINAGGEIVGYVSQPDSEVRLPALWREGDLELLHTPDEPGGVATGINDTGVVAGYLQMPEGDPRPVVWREGVPTVLDTPVGVGYAYAVNKHGQVVGEVEVVDGTWQPALWDEGRLTILDTGDGVGGHARDINDVGQIAGHLQVGDPGPGWDAIDPVHAVMWDRGELRVLGPRGSCAWEISDAGIVVGTTPDPDGTVNADGEILPRAVTWHDGEMTWIDAGEGMTEGLGMAIEDGVGVAISARSGEGPPFALLVTANGPISLERLGEMSKPEGINADGVVVGSVLYSDLGSQPVRWIPVAALLPDGG